LERIGTQREARLVTGGREGWGGGEWAERRRALGLRVEARWVRCVWGGRKGRHNGKGQRKGIEGEGEKREMQRKETGVEGG